MPAFSPAACIWCLLFTVVVCLQCLDLQLAYVTHNSQYFYSCEHDRPLCSLSSLTDCSCEDLQLSMSHSNQLHSSPAFRVRQLTVWYTSAANTARLLNNSDIKHLTLIRCEVGGPRGAAFHGTVIKEGYFAVQHLEQLTVVHLQRSKQNWDEGKARNTELEVENVANLGTLSDNRVTDRKRNQGSNAESRKEFVDIDPPQIQHIFLGREMGAAFHEQARLGIIYSSVLESGAEVKAYTVQTHIGSDGLLPFHDLHMPPLQEASVIYVSFVY